MAMATLLKKFVNAEEWEAEDLVGRLGLIAHAAFLHAGFLPCGAKPRSGQLLKQAGNTAGSSSILSRRYTAPELARREGAEAAVLMLCNGDGGDFALLIYLTTDRDMERAYRQRLDASVMAPLLSRRRLDDTEPSGSRLCKRLADVACWGLLAELCRRNGLTLTGFASLPEDMVVEILRRVGDGADLARAACASRQLRRLVAEHDVEVWKPRFEATVSEHRSLFGILGLLEYGVWLNWKWRYTKALRLQQFFSAPPPIQSAAPRNARGKRGVACRRRPNVPRCYDDDYDWKQHDESEAVNSPPERIARGKASAEGRHHKVPRHDWNRKLRHGAGAIHSPSSRYRWNRQ